MATHITADADITAWNVQPSECAEAAWDVDIEISDDEGKPIVHGQVTLAAHDGRLVSLAETPEQWISSELLEAMAGMDHDDVDQITSRFLTEASKAIESADVEPSAPLSDVEPYALLSDD